MGIVSSAEVLKYIIETIIIYAPYILESPSALLLSLLVIARAITFNELHDAKNAISCLYKRLFYITSITTAENKFFFFCG